mmetsp:Transcript_46026/g.74029  ORF Transcript_46026/g.74029 Transcript_46026/m.74029 type:complete len:128 (-) Transcript_46026:1822-2205(-)
MYLKQAFAHFEQAVVISLALPPEFHEAATGNQLSRHHLQSHIVPHNFQQQQQQQLQGYGKMQALLQYGCSIHLERAGRSHVGFLGIRAAQTVEHTDSCCRSYEDKDRARGLNAGTVQQVLPLHKSVD